MSKHSMTSGCSIDRRSLLKATGSIGLAATLAGCTGGDDEDQNGNGNGNGNGTGNGNGNGNGGGTQRADVAWRIYTDNTAEALGWNPFNPFTDTYGQELRPTMEVLLGYWPFLEEPATDYHSIDGDFHSILLESWEIDTHDDHQTLRLQIRDGMTFHDGSPVTGEDLRAFLRVDRYFVLSAIWDHVDRHEFPVTADGQTLELETDQVYNELHLLDSIASGHETWAFAPDAEFSVFYEALEGAGDPPDMEVGADPDAPGEEGISDEMAEILVEIMETSWDTTKSCGPFKLGHFEDDVGEFVPHEDHPAAELINFQRYETDWIPEAEVRTQAFRSDDLHVHPDVEDDLWATLEDKAIRISNVLPGTTEALEFPRHHQWLGNRNVRRALLHLVNRRNLDINRGDGEYIEHNPVCMVPDDQHDRWLGDLQNDMIDYGVESQPDEATALLEGEGFYQDGDQWMTPDDEEFTVNVKVPPWGDVTGETVSSQFRQFGLASNLDVVTRDVYWGDFGSPWDEDDPGDFLWYPWQGSGTTFPGFWDTWTNWRGPDEGAFTPEVLEVPALGDPNGSDELALRVIDGGDERSLRSEIAFATPERTEEIVQQLAWAYNVDPPAIPLNWRIDGYLFNTEDFSYPDEDSSAWRLDEVRNSAHFFGGVEYDG